MPKKTTKSTRSLSPDPHKNLVLHDFARYFFMLVIVGVLLLFFWIISPFFNVLIYATLISVFFRPLYLWFLKRVRGHSGIAAFISTLLVMVIVLTPLALFTFFLIQQAVDAYEILDNKLVQVDFDAINWERGLSDIPFIGDWWNYFAERYGLEDLLSNDFNVLQVVQDVGEAVTGYIVAEGAGIVKSVGDVIISIFIFLLTTFFFFRDGDHFTSYLKGISPLPNKYENEIQHKLGETTYAIVMGNFATSFLQGVVGAIGFAIADVDNVLFWGTLMAFASLIPYVGASLVWFPSGAALMLQGEMGWGLFLMLWGLIAVSMTDNLVRPYLIGNHIKMHPLATFLAVLGGIFIFGLKGIIFGPLILSLTVTIIHIYQLEYRDVLRP